MIYRIFPVLNADHVQVPVYFDAEYLKWLQFCNGTPGDPDSDTEFATPQIPVLALKQVTSVVTVLYWICRYMFQVCLEYRLSCWI